MSRIGAGEPIRVAPTSNVYTGLAAAAVIVQILGLLVIVMRSGDVGGIF
ncbi:MAG TPA: hypothetical protein VER17_09535 [Tepidisphaeraceae bacterium]|nr:hypothetical protein [Tepidisphaeraceae bacterium]